MNKFIFLKEGKMLGTFKKEEIDENILFEVYGVRASIISTKKGKYIIYEN